MSKAGEGVEPSVENISNLSCSVQILQYFCRKRRIHLSREEEKKAAEADLKNQSGDLKLGMALLSNALKLHIMIEPAVAQQRDLVSGERKSRSRDAT